MEKVNPRRRKGSSQREKKEAGENQGLSDSKESEIEMREGEPIYTNSKGLWTGSGQSETQGKELWAWPSRKGHMGARALGLKGTWATSQHLHLGPWTLKRVLSFLRLGFSSLPKSLRDPSKVPTRKG
ncbi:hypothetical protein Salat_0834400 [Sesamum alatum]|uniref:Uncharacterized protein n=1 Tax=Sesamum alatum TaxID=300844 RepID=A0AAE2CQG4_9LAMI|nr:hypothetical protein Salat_0834400 [Sesamum alatum]